MGSPEEHSHSPQPDSQSPGVPRHPRPPPLEHRDLTGELSAERNRLSRTQAHLCLQLLNLERAFGSLYPYGTAPPHRQSNSGTKSTSEEQDAPGESGLASGPDSVTPSSATFPPRALRPRLQGGRRPARGLRGDREEGAVAGRTAPSCRACSRCRRALGCVRTGGGSRGQQLGGASQQLPTEGRTAAAPLTDKEARGAAPVPKVAVLGPGSPCPDPVLPRLSGGVTLTWHSGPS